VLEFSVEIFKYLPAEAGLDVLETGEVIVTPPKYFNDPFEFTPRIRSRNPEQYALRQFRELTTSPEFFEKNRDRFPLLRSFDDFRRELLRNRRERLNEFVAGIRRNDQQVQDALLDYLSSHFGVICFAANGLDAAMWANYAANHSGLLLGFDRRHPLFSSSAFVEMSYSDIPVTYDASAAPNLRSIKGFIRHKHSHWKHERESRLIVPLSLARTANRSAGRRYVVPFEGSTLVSVTVGLRASSDLLPRVIRRLKVPELAHVRIFKVAKHPDALTLLRLPS
jgi:hypothetical protein